MSDTADPITVHETKQGQRLARSGWHALGKLALVVNLIVIAALAWHVAFEVLPGIARQFAAHRHLTTTESVAVLARVSPYLLLSAYLACRPSAGGP